MGRAPVRGYLTPGYLTPYVVLGIGLIVTFLVARGFQMSAEQRDRTRFENAVQSTTDRIANRLDTYVAVLLATRGFLVSSDHVSRGEFARFVQELELERLYPGIQGIGLSLRVDPLEREAFEVSARAEGIERFRVWPEGERDELHAIRYIEPLDRRNRAALGYDMYTEPVRRVAMDRARDTGLPAASGGVTLVQEIDEDRQPGFLIYVPLYMHEQTGPPMYGGTDPSTLEERRERLSGFVYSPFRMRDLLSGIFGSELQPRVAFSIYDGTGEDAELLLDSEPTVRQAAFTGRQPLTFAGHTWTLEFRSQPAFEAGSSSRFLPHVVVTGLGLSLLLFWATRRQARANKELRLHSRVLDSMAEGVSVTDPRGSVLYTNPAEDAMFGRGRGELLGEPITAQSGLGREETSALLAHIAAALSSRGSWEGELENVREDGARFVTSVHVTGIEIGRRSFWVWVQQDVTEQRRMQSERDELLERELQARAQAEAASRAKDEFLALLGHELRNPLAPIATALDVIKMRRGGELDGVHRVIERQVIHLKRLVDDLLDISRITRGKVELEQRPVSIRSAVARAVEMASPLIEQRQHRLSVEIEQDVAVSADELRLAQVLANLLTNAAKYTHRDGAIEVRARRESETLVLSVRDDGIGISPELLPRIFDLFAQGQRTLDRAEGGLGLGLALVKRLVEAHGGSVEASSEGIGRGSEFVVRLPALELDALPRDEASPEPAAPHPSGRLLVVDDNADAASLIADALTRTGYDVRVAHDGPTALELAERFRPDAAVLDIGLPVMDGWELGQALRERLPLVLVALTGYGQSVDRERSLRAGFADHLVKPVHLRELRRVLEAHLRQSGSADAAPA